MPRLSFGARHFSKAALRGVDGSVVSEVSPCEIHMSSERIENPTLIRVASGVELVVNVETPASSAISRSFLVKTSIAAQ